MSKIKQWAEDNIILGAEYSPIAGRINFDNNKKIGIPDYRPLFDKVEKNNINEFIVFRYKSQSGASTFCLILASYYIMQGRSILYIIEDGINIRDFEKTKIKPFLNGVNGIQIEKNGRREKLTKKRFSNGASLTIVNNRSKNFGSRYEVVIGDISGNIEDMKHISCIYRETRKIIKT